MQTMFDNVVSIAQYRPSTYAASASRETTISARPKASASHRSRRSSTSSLEDVHDDEIVERLALGDLEAAETLRARYIRQLRHTAATILGDEREVARVVETALEEACSGWPPERGEVGRWLTRLARRGGGGRPEAGRSRSSTAPRQPDNESAFVLPHVRARHVH